MDESSQPQASFFVAAGQDQFAEHRGLGVSAIHFKVSGQDSPNLLVLENVFHHKGGPAKHLHHFQDEWFYVLEGEFLIEVDEERRRLQAGDSISRIPARGLRGILFSRDLYYIIINVQS